jgi:hypothetical protein
MTSPATTRALKRALQTVNQVLSLNQLVLSTKIGRLTKSLSTKSPQIPSKLAGKMRKVVDLEEVSRKKVSPTKQNHSIVRAKNLTVLPVNVPSNRKGMLMKDLVLIEILKTLKAATIEDTKNLIAQEKLLLKD